MSSPVDYQRLISPVLRQARQAAGLDGAQLAEALGLSPAAISRWETANMDGSMPIHRLFEVAEASGLGVDLTLRPGPHACRVELNDDPLLRFIRDALATFSDADREALRLLVEFAVRRRQDERLKVASNS